MLKAPPSTFLSVVHIGEDNWWLVLYHIYHDYNFLFPYIKVWALTEILELFFISIEL